MENKMDVNGKPLNPKDIKYSIIHHYNSPNSCVRDDGKVMTRKNEIFIKEYGKFVMCAPDDTHFIYEEERKNFWSFMCTCGSPAVITGSKAYAGMGSPTNDGMMITCMMFLTTGKHQTSFIVNGGVK
jgi:hypothetical protein